MFNWLETLLKWVNPTLIYIGMPNTSQPLYTLKLNRYMNQRKGSRINKMKTNNYKSTHIRIFDKNGLIFSASPNIDAYDLSRAVLDVIQNQTEPDFVRLMRQEYADNFDSEYITFDATIEGMKYDIEECGLRSLYEIANRLSTNDFTDEFINHYLDVNVPVLGLRGVADDLINAKMLLYAAGETRYADITPEPAYMAMMREDYANVSGSGIADAITTVRDDYTNDEIFTKLNKIADGLQHRGFSEEFLARYLDVNEPLPHDRNTEVDVAIMDAKILLHITGLTRYNGLRATPDSDRAKFAALNIKLLSFDESEYQNVADILSSDVLYEGTDWCTPEDWETDRRIIAYREMLDIIATISEPVIFDAPSGEYVYDACHIYAADATEKPEEAYNGIIKAKQCLECGSMDTIDAGSGAGCCNVCGCWIPDYNTEKRMWGKFQ